MTRRQRLPFDGETFDPALDGARLTRQLDIVRRELANGHVWWTLAALEAKTTFPQASISARIRDLRKRKHGAHEIERRRVKECDGLWEYRMTPAGASVPDESFRCVTCERLLWACVCETDLA